jgi:TatD DNase family protein
MIDSHCHLDVKEYKGHLDEIINTAVAAGVHTIINIGADPLSSAKSVELAEKYDNIFATVGVHPHDAKIYTKEIESRLCQFLERKKVVAIGEIGLDYYRDLSPRHIQKAVFRSQLELAAARKFPIVIHTREAFRDTVDIIREYSSRLAGGIFHCFPGTLSEAQEVIDLGFYISVGGIITYPKAKMAEVAAGMPLEYILLETDSPYLTPIPFRGKTNQPAHIKIIAEKLAELRNIPFAEVEKVTDRNCRKVYRLEETFGG